MHEHGLARDLWPQLEQIAATNGYSTVTRVDMTVGSLHGVSADFLAHSFQHAFEGTSFHGAEVNITVIDPGETLTLGSSAPTVASGWELLITRMEGEEA